jgi:flagellar assembly protein FliH
MPSFDQYQVFVTEDRVENRPKAIFDKKKMAEQSFRTFEFRNVSMDAREEDLERLREAAAEARAEFERELERRVAEAERRGQDLGLQEATALHAEERKKLVERMEGAVSAFNQALDRAEDASARDAVRLGLLVAERLTRTQLTRDPEAVVSTLESALESLEGEEAVQVTASPELAESLRARTSDIMEELEVSGFEVEADETLQPGDLIIHRGASTLDARVARRIQKIEARLLRELGLDGAPQEET